MVGRTVTALALAVVLALAGACTGEGEGTGTDEQLREDVATALYAANIPGVEVAVSGGVVTLTGSAATQAAADRAAEVARTVAGVKDVRNEIAVAASATPVEPPPVVNPEQPDTIAAARIQQRLIADPDLAGSKITPTVAGGVATLAGTVPSEAAKAAAEKIARSVEGVTSVTNNLSVVAAAPVATRTDGQIEDDVNTLLDQQFSELSLFVEVEGGVVKLSGAVPDRSRIVQVSKAVYNVAGVKSVDTARLTIKGGEPEDQKLGAPADS